MGSTSDKRPHASKRASLVRTLLVACGRLIVAWAGLAAAAVVVYLAIRRPEPLLSGVAPAALASGLLLTVHHGYQALRALRWLGRQRRESRARASLRIPGDVSKPTAFTDVVLIDAAQKAFLTAVPGHQGDMYARGVKVAILPAIAVLVAALPNLRPSNIWWSAGSAAAELAALATVIYLVLTKPHPSRPWVQARTRAELLRREQYLRLAQVGPYLNLTDDEAAETTRQRLEALAPESDVPLADLIPLRNRVGGRRWIDQLWSSSPQQLPDLRQRALSYLYYRIGRQMMWFRLGVSETADTERRIGRVIGASLVFAMAIIAVQIVLRVAEPVNAHPYPAFATLLALDLPPLAACLISVRELYAYRGRSASYAQTLATLGTERTVLSELINEIDSQPGDRVGATREFQALVLHVEAVLTIELETWIMITERDRFDIDV